MSQEPASNEPVFDEILSDDQLDQVAGGVLFSMNEDLIVDTGTPTPPASTAPTSQPNIVIDVNAMRAASGRTPAAAPVRTDLTANTTPTFTNPAQTWAQNSTAALQRLGNSARNR